MAEDASQSETRKQESPEELEAFIEKAKDSVGLGDVDLGALIADLLKTNEEDRAWRAEVFRRMDILIENQQRIYGYLTRDETKEE